MVIIFYSTITFKNISTILNFHLVIHSYLFLKPPLLSNRYLMKVKTETSAKKTESINLKNLL